MVRNTFYIFSARVSNALFILLLTLAVSRMLGPSLFGLYSFLTTVVVTATCFSNYGLDTWMVREVAKAPDKGKFYLSNVLGLKMATSLVAVLLIIIAFRPASLLPTTEKLLWVLSLSLFFNSLAQTLWHYGDCFNKFIVHSILWSMTNLIKSSVGIILLFLYTDLTPLIWGMVFAEAIALLFSFYILKSRFGKISLSFDFQIWKEFLSRSTPMAWGAIFSALYFRLDVVMLQLMTKNEVVGWYSASYKLIEAFTMIPHSMILVLFPTMVQDIHQAPQKFRSKVITAFFILFTLGAGSALLLSFYSESIIFLIYGEMYGPSAPALKILSWTLFFIFLNYLLANILISSGKEKVNTYNIIFATFLNFGLNLVLIPEYAHIGAAWATLISEFILMVLISLEARQVLKNSPPQKDSIND